MLVACKASAISNLGPSTSMVVGSNVYFKRKQTPRKFRVRFSSVELDH